MKKSEHNYDVIVVGGGFAGAVVTREMAERAGKKVLLLESRSHIGGGAYDCLNEDGVWIHQYGPHIFHTNNKRAYDYLSRFAAWRSYEHEVAANLDNTLLPVPFNLNSLRMVFPKEIAARLQQKLITYYGYGAKVIISELHLVADNDLAILADFVYHMIFKGYTQKQWGLSPDQLDYSVTARVPIHISHDNRYFQDRYQGIPKDGYCKLFANMLAHSNITLCLNTKASECLSLRGQQILLWEKPFNGEVIYTGPVDELFDCRFGCLPYRTLDFVFETYPQQKFQSKATVNYTVSEAFTRITEFKHLTGQDCGDKTTILKEYPRAYDADNGDTPYYPIANAESDAIYHRYTNLAAGYKRLHLLGRLAQYKYYNMDAVVEQALKLADALVAGKEIAV